MSASYSWEGKGGRQVWLMPIADERVGVQVKLWDVGTREVVIHYEEALYQVYVPSRTY